MNPQLRCQAHLSILSATLVLVLVVVNGGCVAIDPWEAPSRSYDQVKNGSLELRGMTAQRVESTLGPPRYRATLSSAKQRAETWTYVYPNAPTRITVTFSNARVTDVEVTEVDPTPLRSPPRPSS